MYSGGEKGHLLVHDLKTGAFKWRFYIVPGDPKNPLEHIEMVEALKTWDPNSRWDVGGGGTAWDSMLEDIGGLSLNGKKVAIFGLGDSSTYTENFCDAMEELHSYFKKAGATMVGYVGKGDYTFEESKSVVGDSFCGLPLDEDSESDMTDSRISQWADQLKGEMPGVS